jgi:hypothetical protein
MSCVEHDGNLPADEVSAAATRVVDIRGQRVRPPVTPVLADPSGVRARRLARTGRAIAFLCLLWLVGLGLAGLGILPAADLPLGGAISGAVPVVARATPVPGPSRYAPARAASPRATSAPVVNDSPPSGAGLATGWQNVRAGTRRGLSAWGATGRGRSPGRPTAPGAAASRSGPASGARGNGTASATVPAPSGAASAPGQTAAGGSSNRGVQTTGRGIATAPGTVVKSDTPGHGGTPEHTSPSPRSNSGNAARVGPTAATVTTAPGGSGSSPGHAITPGGGHGNGA